MIVDHDVHVHTVLSACCSDERATPANIIARAAEVGLKTIGFADHLWDSAVPGGSNWYRPQDVAHVLRTRDALANDARSVRVLVGCESDYCGGGKVGITPESARQFDFVLLPMSHFHMRGFVVPEGLADPGQIAHLLVQRFNEVVELGLATGIPHPFLPVGDAERVDEITSHLSDDDLKACFGRAAQRHVSVEVSTAMFPSCEQGEEDGFHDESFLRILRIAKRSGCLFHFASDSHSLAGIGRVLKLAPIADDIGITPDDIHPLFRS
ncbi:MAG: PHP domain-containing protein [Phycisphaerae bacterium]